MLRTYKRKRPGSTLIEGVEDLCRLCLGKCDEWFPIFTHAEDFNIPLAVRITQCIGLPISEEKNLPNMICKECKKEIEQYSSFRKRCELTYQKLKSHQQAVKDCHLISQAITALKNSGNTESCDASLINKIAEDRQTTAKNITTNEKLSEFLTRTLVELGVLASGAHLERLDQNIGTIELEVGDSNQYTYELVEEDDSATELQPNHLFKNQIHQDQDVKKETSHKQRQHHKPVSQSDTVQTNQPNNQTQQVKSGNKWRCEECDKWFMSRGVLRRHRRTHGAARPHWCSACGRRFKHLSVLTRHRLLHAAVRPHTCPVRGCGRGYTQREGLLAHARSHHAPRALQLHTCDSCPKLFLHASGLSRHKFQHSGRKFSCGECGRQFTDDSALRRHHLNKHKNQQTNLIDS